MRDVQRASRRLPGLLALLACLTLTDQICAIDCDNGGRRDQLAIEQDGAADCDLNGIPDVCDLAPTFAVRGLELGPGIRVSDIMVCDIDGDGVDDDLIGYGGGSGVVTVFSGNADGSLSEPRQLRLGVAIRSVAVGEYDDDGWPDIAAIASTGKRLFVLTQNSSGQLSLPQDIELDAQPQDVALGDFDSDRAPEAALLTGSSIVFKAATSDRLVPATLDLGGRASAIEGGDFDDDGRDDLAVLTDAGVFVYWGPINERNFRWPTEQPIARDVSRRDMVARDFDGDGVREILHVIQNRQVVLMDARRGVLLDAEVAIPGVRTATLGDFDGNGKFDLATIENGKLAVRYGGGATFTFGSPETVGASDRGLSLAARDIGGDSAQELITAETAAGLRVTTAELGSGLRTSTCAPLGTVLHTEIHDLDQDGYDDVLVLTSRTLQIVYGAAPGDECTMSDIAAAAAIGSAGLIDMDVGDIDGDGNIEVVVATADAVGAISQVGPREFASRQIAASPLAIADIELGDVNGDGQLDLGALVASGDPELPSSLMMRLNQGDGEFSSARGFRGVPNSLRFGFGDSDGDGHLDALVGGGTAGVVLRNDGRGFLRPSTELDRRFTLVEKGRVISADIDDDGDDEWLIRDQRLTILDETSDGDVETLLRIGPLGAGGIATGDIDGDGTTDIAMASVNTGVDVAYNRGDWSTAEFVSYASGTFPTSVEFGDVDGDGKLDIVAVGGRVATLHHVETAAASDRNRNGIPDSCDGLFVRGDVDADGSTAISDALYLLAYLFGSGDRPACAKAGDVDDNGTLNVSDPVALLVYLFAGGEPPQSPTSHCDVDPTDDELDCERHNACARNSASQ